MKFVRYCVQENETIGILTADGSGVIAQEKWGLNRSFQDLTELIQKITQEELEGIRTALKEGKYREAACPIRQVKLLSPIDRPIHDVICVGVNYRDHLTETKEKFDTAFQEPVKPVYFSKRVVHTVSPEEPIQGHTDVDPCLDYEVELGVIIGKTGTNLSKEEVEDFIFGYTILNDVSARTLQKQHVQWYRGKSMDGFTPMGPVIVTKDEIPFPVELDLCSRVNGELRQDSNTRYFITDIPSLISDLSRGMTLEAGDILATGTPAGVGMAMDPPCYLKVGDVVECEIEKIGVLRNPVE